MSNGMVRRTYEPFKLAGFQLLMPINTDNAVNKNTGRHCMLITTIGLISEFSVPSGMTQAVLWSVTSSSS